MIEIPSAMHAEPEQIIIEAECMTLAMAQVFQSHVRDDRVEFEENDLSDPDFSFESAKLNIEIHRLDPTDEERDILNMINTHDDSPFKGMIAMNE